MKELLVDVNKFSPIIKESKEGSKIFQVEGVMQRAGAKNQNGRIYKREILEREVDNYVEAFVKNKNAYGELDHPECFSETTEVLTSDGWKLFSELAGNETIATLSTDSEKLEYQKPTKLTSEDYEGMMVHLKGKNIDIEVTPNHRVLIKNRKDFLLK